MAYATRADMIQAYGEDELIELTDRADPPTDAIDDAVLLAAIETACAEIDGYVGRVATLPLTLVPPVLRQLALVITRYRLSTDMDKGRVRVDYEDAIHTLESIAKGLVDLGLPSDQPGAVASGRVRGVSAAPVFTAARLGSDWP